MANLLRRQLERNRVFLLVVMLVLGGFEFLLCAIVASVDIETAMGHMLALAPPLLRAMIEQNLMGGTPAGMLAFGWNHPVAHALLTAVAITLAARAIAGEVENGAIEMVLAQPLSRARYFGAHAVFGIAALSVVLAAGTLGTVIGQHTFGLPRFGWDRLAALFGSALLLQLALYAFTLLVSAIGREAGRVALAGVLFAVVSYLMSAIATLWARAAFVKPWSLHGHFDPREILVDGRLAGGSTLVLAGFTALALGAAYARFARRDLP
jgi:ABC-2 type transport system permease protein